MNDLKEFSTIEKETMCKHWDDYKNFMERMRIIMRQSSIRKMIFKHQ